MQRKVHRCFTPLPKMRINLTEERAHPRRQSKMSIFIERYVLPILAALVVALALTNPLAFSWTARIIGIIVLSVVAAILACLMGWKGLWKELRWERLRVSWWLWLVLGLIGGVALNPFLYSLQLGNALTGHGVQPVVTFYYGNTPHYVMPPSDRPREYGGDWVVRIDVASDRVVKNARLRLELMIYSEDGGRSWGPSLNKDYNRAQFGWYAAAHSFDALDISPNLFVVLATVNKAGDELKLFLDPNENVPELSPAREPLRIGWYRIYLTLQADNIINPIVSTWLIKWSGNMQNFDMSRSSDGP